MTLPSLLKHYRMLLRLIVLMILCTMNFGVIAQNLVPDLSLSEYSISIDEDSLAILNSNPWSDRYFQATFNYDTISIVCQVRYRGGSSRALPKKSWKVKFPNSDNPFGVQKLNFNAEYRDLSLLRNYLSMRLFDHFGYLAPKVDFVNLKVNDHWMGVFLEIEQVDDNLLKRYNKDTHTLYKGKEHGANMSPVFNDSTFHFNWEPKIQYPSSDLDIKTLLNKLYYFDRQEFEESIEELVNVSSFIGYFSMVFVLACRDNFTKNLYLWQESPSGLFDVVPWDNDIAFGNTVDGDYMSWWAKATYFNDLNKQVLFRRLMEYPIWREEFENNVHLIASEGLDYAAQLADSIYPLIKKDYYADPQRRGSVEDLEQAIVDLKSYFVKRKENMESFEMKAPKVLTNPKIISQGGEMYSSSIVVKIQSDTAQRVFFNIISGLDQRIWNDEYETTQFELFDDGAHNDQAPGDLIYGTLIDRKTLPKEYMPCYFTNEAGLQYPWNGNLKINIPSNRTVSYAINNRFSYGKVEGIEIEKSYFEDGSVFFELINSSKKPVEMTGMVVRLDDSFRSFTIPIAPFIQSKGSLIVTNNRELSELIFPESHVVGNVGFSVGESKEISILNEFYELISNSPLSIRELGYQKDSIVINEIFYNPLQDFQTDWVELYNAGSTILDLGGWIFQDGKEDNEFRIPYQTIIAPHDYIVLCYSKESIQLEYRIEDKVIGNFDFNLSPQGELLRIKDEYGVVIDSVRYDDAPPWPPGADGFGPSLELINPYLDNSIPANWKASMGGGTPGRKNSVYHGSEDFFTPDFMLYHPFPNPFQGKLCIHFSLDFTARVEARVLDQMGKQVALLSFGNLSPGEHLKYWYPANLPTGIYYLHLMVNGQKPEVFRIVHMKDVIR